MKKLRTFNRAVLLNMVFIFAMSTTGHGQIYIGKSCNISFFSATKMEDIKAVNSVSKPVLNTKNGAFAIKASQNAFVFKSSFMQEHYNENYMESEKFPFATFTGTINETVDFTKDGTTEVSITGTLDMHGVAIPRTIKGTIEVKKGTIIMYSKFDVKVEDHKIKVPSLYVDKIAEIIEVTFEAVLEPMAKKN